MSKLRQLKATTRRIASLLERASYDGDVLRQSFNDASSLPVFWRKAFFSLLLKEISLRLEISQRILDFAGNLSAEKIQELVSIFSKYSPFKPFKVRENPTLLAGIRVIIGDRRWESSLRAALDQFSAH